MILRVLFTVSFLLGSIWMTYSEAAECNLYSNAERHELIELCTKRANATYMNQSEYACGLLSREKKCKTTSINKRNVMISYLCSNTQCNWIEVTKEKTYRCNAHSYYPKGQVVSRLIDCYD